MSSNMLVNPAPSALTRDDWLNRKALQMGENATEAEQRWAANRIHKQSFGRESLTGREYSPTRQDLGSWEYLQKMQKIVQEGTVEHLWSQDYKDFNAIDKADHAARVAFVNERMPKEFFEKVGDFFHDAQNETLTQEELELVPEIDEAGKRAQGIFGQKEGLGTRLFKGMMGDGSQTYYDMESDGDAYVKQDRELSDQEVKAERERLDGWRKLANERRQLKAYEIELQRQNAWAVVGNIKGMIKSSTGKQVIDYALSNEGMLDDWHRDMFTCLDLKEQRQLVPMLDSLKEAKDTTLVGDVARGFWRTAYGTYEGMGEWLRNGIDRYRAEDNEVAQIHDEMKALIGAVDSRPQKDWGFWGNALVGVGATFGYAAALKGGVLTKVVGKATALQSAGRVLGTSAVVLDQANNFVDRIALEGGDVTSAETQIGALVAGTAYAAVERAQFGRLFGPINKLGSRKAFLGTAKGITRGLKLAGYTVGNVGSEILEEGVQAGIEESFVAMGTDRDVARAFAEGTVREMKDSLGTMAIMGVAGTARQGVRYQQGGFESLDEAAKTARRTLEFSREYVDGKVGKQELTDFGHEMGMIFKEWIKVGGNVDLFTTATKLDAASAVNFHLAFQTIYGQMGGDAELLQRATGGLAVQGVNEQLEAAMPWVQVEQDAEEGAFRVTRKADAVEGSPNVDLLVRVRPAEDFKITDADLEDNSNVSLHTSIVNALRNSGVDMTLEKFQELSLAERQKLRDDAQIEQSGQYVATDKDGNTLRDDELGALLPDADHTIRGTIELNAAMLPVSQFHEIFHGAIEMMRNNGLLQDVDISALKTFFGAPEYSGEVFNEEVGADAYRDYLVNNNYNPVAKDVFEKLADGVGKLFAPIRALKKQKAQELSDAQQFFENMRTGNFRGIPILLAKSDALAKKKAQDAEAQERMGEETQGRGSERDGAGEPPAVHSQGDTPVNLMTDEIVDTGKWSAVTPDGSMTLDGEWAFMSLGDLLTSSDDGYAQELQPRERTSVSSRAQIQRIAQNVDPSRLMDAATTDQGAPIVTSDGMVLSGNGRVLALREAQKTGGLARYAEAMNRRGIALGVDTSSMDTPVLVRKLNAGVPVADLVKAAELSNRASILQRTEVETAEADVKILSSSSLLDMMDTGERGDLSLMSNRSFMNVFIEKTGDQSLRMSDGTPATAAYARVRRAALAAVFDGIENYRDFMRLIFERGASEDGAGVKREIDGIMRAAPQLVRLAQKKPEYAINQQLAIAFARYMDFRNSGAAPGTVEAYIAQQDMFAERDTFSDDILREFGIRHSAPLIADLLGDYATRALKADSTPDMFGNPGLTAPEIFKVAAEKTLPVDLAAQQAEESARLRSLGARASVIADNWAFGGNGDNAEELRTVEQSVGMVGSEADKERMTGELSEAIYRGLGDDREAHTWSGADLVRNVASRYSVRGLYTGSATKYDKPSLHAVGSGDGNLAFGWGLYAADSREVAELYTSDGGYVYEQTWWTNREGDGANLLDHEQPVPRAMLKKVLAGMEEWAKRNDDDWGQLKKYIGFDADSTITGADLYGSVADVVGGAREASECLSALCDIDGMRYKNAQGTGFNYVAFSDAHLRIDHAWEGEDTRYSVTQKMRPVYGSGQLEAVKHELINKPFTNALSGITAEVSGGSLKKLKNSSAVERSFSPQAHYQGVANLDTLYVNAIPVMDRASKKGSGIKRIHHFIAPISFFGEILQARLMVKEFERTNQANQIYLLSVVETENKGQEANASQPSRLAKELTSQQEVTTQVSRAHSAPDVESAYQMAKSPEDELSPSMYLEYLKLEEAVKRENGSSVNPKLSATRKVRFSVSAKERKSWNDALSAYERGKSKGSYRITLFDSTPPIVREIFRKFYAQPLDSPIVTTAGILDKATKGVTLQEYNLMTAAQKQTLNTKHKHHVLVDDLRSLQDYIDDPILVLRSATNPNAIVVFTTIMDYANEKLSVVPIEFQVGANTGTMLNFVPSIYGKGKDWLADQISKGNLLYFNTQKRGVLLAAKERLSFSPKRLQLPQNPSGGTPRTYLTEADFSQVSESNLPQAGGGVNPPQARKSVTARFNPYDETARTARGVMIADIIATDKVKGIKREEAEYEALAKTYGANLEESRKMATDALEKLAAKARKDPSADEVHAAVSGEASAQIFERVAREIADKATLAQKGVMNAQRWAIEQAPDVNLQRFKNETGVDPARDFMNILPKDFDPDNVEPPKKDATPPQTEGGSEDTEGDDAPPEPTAQQQADFERDTAAREASRNWIKEGIDAYRQEEAIREAQRDQQRENSKPRSSGGSQDGEFEQTSEQWVPPVVEGESANIKTAGEFARGIRLGVQRWLESQMTDVSGNIWANPANRESLRKSMQGILKDIAKSHIDPKAGNAYNSIMNAIRYMELGTVANMERRTAEIIGMIHRNAIHLTSQQLMSNLRADVKKGFITAGKLDALEKDSKRKIKGEHERHARFIYTMLDWSDNYRAKMQKECMDTITRRTQGYSQDDESGEIDVATDAEIYRAQERMNAMDRWGGLQNKLPAEIQREGALILEQLNGKRAEHLAHIEKIQQKRDALAHALVQAISLDTSKVRPEWGWLRKFGDELTGTVRQRLAAMLFANPKMTDAERTSAQNVLDDVMDMISAGSEKYRRAVQRYNQEVADCIHEAVKGSGMSYRDFLRMNQKRIPKKLALALSDKVSQGHLTRMTWGQAAQLYASLSQTTSYATNIEKNNRKGQLELLKQELPVQFLRYVSGMRRVYQKRREELSVVQERVTGFPIRNPDPLYMPVKMWKEPHGNFDIEINAYSPIPKAFAPRVKNDCDFDESADILDVTVSAARNSALTLAFAESGLDLRSILMRKDVYSAMVRFHGKEAAHRLKQQVTDHLTAGYRKQQESATEKTIQVASSIHTLSVLSYNIGSSMKQVAGLPSWVGVLDGGYGQLAHHLGQFFGDKEAKAELMASPGFEVRYGAETFGKAFKNVWKDDGFKREIQTAWLGDGIDSVRKFYQMGMNVIQIGDFVASKLVAVGVYADYKKKLLARGLSEAEARERAAVHAWAMVEEAQQSDRPENTPDFLRRRGYFAKQMYKFASSQMLQTSHEITAFMRWKDSGWTDEAARKKFANTVIANHVILPFCFTLIEVGLGIALDGIPDDEDWKWDVMGKFLLEALTGPFARIILFGSVAKRGVAGLLNLAGFNTRVYQSGSISSIDFIERLIRNGILTVEDFNEGGWDEASDGLIKMASQFSVPFRYGAKTWNTWVNDDEEDRKAN